MIPPWPVVSALRWAAWVMPTAAVGMIKECGFCTCIYNDIFSFSNL